MDLHVVVRSSAETDMIERALLIAEDDRASRATIRVFGHLE